MIDASQLYLLAAGVYLVGFLGLLAWRQRLPEDVHRYCDPVVAAAGLSVIGAVADATGAGTVAVAGGELGVLKVLTDLAVYGLLWGVTALLADVSRRTLAVVAGISMAQVLAFQVAALIGGLPALVGLLVLVGGHVAVAYLLVGPIWREAKALPEDRRVLHWKARNLLLFLIGVLIAFAVTGILVSFDAFVSTLVTVYIGVLIRVGFAGFLFWNVSDLADERPDDSTGAGGDAPTAAVGGD